jgi:hypothetical protein
MIEQPYRNTYLLQTNPYRPGTQEHDVACLALADRRDGRPCAPPTTARELRRRLTAARNGNLLATVERASLDTPNAGTLL